MKKSVLVLLMMIATSVIAQEQSFHYKFKLDGVVDLPTAKEIKDPLRAKFLCYTVYDDVAQQFDFISNVNVNESQLQLYLNDYGYVITEFQKLPVEAQINNKK